jgi:hypothetical protein
MEFLLIIAGLWIVGWIFQKFQKPSDSSNPRSGSQTSSQARTPSQPPPSQPPPKDVYRPRSTGGRSSGIVFKSDSPGAQASTPSEADLKGLHDAFTGAPLNIALGLHQCTRCKVYYHAESVSVIREENRAQCVACGTASIVALSTEQATKSRGRDYAPDIVTLANYRSHFGRVVTFEGKVRAVRVSQRGSDFAVMFEQKSWTSGFKLVFFRGAVRKVGGPEFIKNLDGHQLRVRGLLVNHPKFGPEIIVSERSMILEVA